MASAIDIATSRELLPVGAAEMDNANPRAMMKALGPKVPLILKTSAMHTMGMSAGAKYWDLRTELFITVLRSFIDGSSQPTSISKQQRLSVRAAPVPGYLWVSRTQTEAPPEDDMRQMLFRTFDDLKDGPEVYSAPDTVAVEAEWHGQRKGVDAKEPEPSIPEPEKYQRLVKDAESDLVVLYFHGGAMYLMDPATHRIPVSAKLARRTKGRIFSIRYRLAPQHPFPSALLDAFQSYLALLSPPPGALHEPVPAGKIVFSGDSAGGNLCMSLLQLVLRNVGQKIRFHGKEVEVQAPAGLALSSPWMDVTRGLPSIEDNAKFDYLPPPSKTSADSFPPCEIWPSKPPRGDMYCETSALCHPLVSPLAAKDWTGAPPVYMTMGQEMLEDECRVVASHLARQGVVTVVDVYEAMPHCFPMLLAQHPAHKGAFDAWAGFITACVENPSSLSTKGTWLTAKKLEKSDLRVEDLARQSDTEVAQMMQEAQRKRFQGIEREAKAMPAPKL